MEDVLIPIVAILSTIALPIVTALVLILKKLNADHNERMALINQGIIPPNEPKRNQSQPVGFLAQRHYSGGIGYRYYRWFPLFAIPRYRGREQILDYVGIDCVFPGSRLSRLFPGYAQHAEGKPNRATLRIIFCDGRTIVCSASTFRQYFRICLFRRNLSGYGHDHCFEDLRQ